MGRDRELRDAGAEAEVTAAAERLVAAYGAHDTERYFACFHPNATFVFYTSPQRLDSRKAFRDEWERWEREDGFHVLECRSANHRVQMFGDVAVFTHTVRTRLSTAGGEEASIERETIVFVRQEGGSWLAVHEHLSPGMEAE